MPPKNPAKPDPGPKAEPKPPPAGMTLEVVRSWTFLTDAQIKRLVRDGYIPAPVKKHYDLGGTFRGVFKWYHEQITQPLTVDKDRLRELTGLSDQRHRQLANEGRFPQPIKGRWDPWEVAKGVIQHYRELHARRDRILSEKREKKMDTEQELLDMTLAEKKEQLISVDLMESKLRPFLVSARQKILGCTMTDDEKDELLTDLGGLLENAFANRSRTIIKKAGADPVPAAAADSQQVG